jgi:hypothetical protein
MDSQNSSADDAGTHSFWSDFFRARINLASDFVVAKWAGAGTICWFFYMLLFASGIYYLYEQNGQLAQAAAIIGVFIALNAAGLVTMYLATLADGTHADEENEANPFALSLQAMFIESLVVTGTLIFVLASYVMENFRAIREFLIADTQNAPQISDLADHVGVSDHGSYLSNFIERFVDNGHVFWPVAALAVLIVLVAWVAHKGFVLLTKRHKIAVQYSGTFQNTGEPPISSEKLKLRISELRQLSGVLAAKSERESTLAAEHEELAADFARRMKEAEALRQTLLHEEDLLAEDQLGYQDCLASVKSQHESLVTKSGDATRPNARKFLTKIAEFTATALGILLTSDRTFGDARASLIRKADGAKAVHDEAQAAMESHAKAARDHQLESERLAHESEALDAEILDLAALAEKIDEKNEEWRQPFDWSADVLPRSLKISHVIPSANYHSGRLADNRKDKLAAVQNGTFMLFIFASLFLVVGDLLIDIYKFKAPGTGAGASGLAPHWQIYVCFAGLALLIFWVMKGVSMLGFMGSWRAIMVAPMDGSKSHEAGVKTDLDQMWSAVSANIAAIAGFAAVVAIILAVSGYWKADKHSPIWYFVAGLEFMPILPYLGGAAGLAVAAPIAVWVFQRYVRQEDRRKKALQQLLFAGLVTGVLLLSAAFGALGSLIGIAAQSTIHAEKRDPVDGRYVNSRMECQFEKIPGTNSAVIDADWVYAAPNATDRWSPPSKISGKTKHPLSPCNFTVGAINVADGTTRKPTFIAVISSASQEGKPADQNILSDWRAYYALDNIVANYRTNTPHHSNSVDVYKLSLGIFSPKDPKMDTQATAEQRPVIVIIGSETDETAREASIKKILSEKLYLSFDEKSQSLWTAFLNYKNACLQRFTLPPNGDLKPANSPTCPRPKPLLAPNTVPKK